MPRVEFEHMIPVFERPQTARPLGPAIIWYITSKYTIMITNNFTYIFSQRWEGNIEYNFIGSW
jgi:hypothetical protein